MQLFIIQHTTLSAGEHYYILTKHSPLPLKEPEMCVCVCIEKIRILRNILIIAGTKEI